MENEIQIFENPEFGKVRTVQLDDEPWFVGKDVAEALGYSETAKAIRMHVDEDDKGVSVLDTPGGKQKTTVINESGVYALVFGSKLPNAKAFKHWVTHDVLPSIRKHGAYATPDTIDKILTNPDFGIRLLTELKKEREKSAAQAAELEAAKPKVIFADAVATAKTTILIGALAKLLKQNGVNIGQNRLFKWMREHGYLIKHGDNKNMPTQTAMEMKLFEVKVGTYIDANGANQTTRTTKVTGKGQQYFINKFLAEEG